MNDTGLYIYHDTQQNIDFILPAAQLWFQDNSFVYNILYKHINKCRFGFPKNCSSKDQK